MEPQDNGGATPNSPDFEALAAAASRRAGDSSIASATAGPGGGGRSRWNRWLDRALATPGLSASEFRLLLALARLTLGWRRTEAELGDRLIRDTARLDGRSFTRARTRLAERQLIAYTPGRRGRGGRSVYGLILEGSVENVPAAMEGPASAAAEKPALVVAEKTALARARIEESREKPKAFSYSSTPGGPAARANGPQGKPQTSKQGGFDPAALAKIAALSAGIAKDLDEAGRP